MITGIIKSRYEEVRIDLSRLGTTRFLGYFAFSERILCNKNKIFYLKM